MGQVENDTARIEAAKLESTDQLRQPSPVVPETSQHAAIDAAFGLFKGKEGCPQDGLKFQLEVRAEWP